jgi:hypothetical protein
MEFSNGAIAIILVFNAGICLLLPRILTFNWSRFINIAGNEANS